MKTILIVDDTEMDHEILSDALAETYKIDHAYSGKEALERINKTEEPYAALLLDLVMPGMTGFQVLEKLNEQGITDNLPVIIISGESDNAERECLKYGVIDFIHKPFDFQIAILRVRNAVNLFSYKTELEQTVYQQTVDLKEQNDRLNETASKLHQNVVELIDILGASVEARDTDTGGHIQRVKGYTRIFANGMAKLYPEYELTPEYIDKIVETSSLHDIGKLKVSDAILLKPGRLTDEEFAEIKKHPVYGCELLKRIHGIWESDPEYRDLCFDICRYHHERYDGKGYAQGLEGDDIPVSAMLVSLADVYDALTHDRVYKEAFSKEEAYKMITNGECGAFHPKLLNVFNKYRSEIERV